MLPRPGGCNLLTRAAERPVLEDLMATDWKLYQDTGYAPIDTEHAEISQGLEKLLVAVNAGKPSDTVLILEALAGQVAAHFTHEEWLMARSSYPLAVRHKQAHDGFMADATKFLAELKANGLTASFRRWATGRVLEWFRFHIAANDVGLGRFLLDLKAASLESVDLEPARA
jgi:hemerythrin-like metal-binding protein